MKFLLSSLTGKKWNMIKKNKKIALVMSYLLP